ncbi:MAG: aminotransferase class III-fold pyridoxal phosphate-dependent enzyme, partial [Chloroflexota bacterium]
KLEQDGFRYVQSHQNDPLGCAIAKEVIAIFREEFWVEKGDAKGQWFLDGLKQLKRHEVVKEARGRGMELALEFQPQLSAASVYQTLLETRFLVGYYPAGNILRFDPALTIEQEDIAHLLECLDSMLEM